MRILLLEKMIYRKPEQLLFFSSSVSGTFPASTGYWVNVKNKYPALWEGWAANDFYVS